MLFQILLMKRSCRCSNYDDRKAAYKTGGMRLDLLERLEKRDEAEEKKYFLGFEGRSKAFETIITSGICLLIIIAAIVYVLNSRIIYAGENSTYWDICRNIVKGKLDPDFWRNVYNSISTRENNYLSALIPSAWMSLFGTSRLSYVISIVLFYVLPSVWITKRLSVKFTEMPVIGVVVGTFMVPFTLYMALEGYTDVGAMTLALFCYNLYYTKDGPSKNILTYIVIGVILILTMLFSSYFAFFSISFLTSMCIESMLGDGKWRYTIFTILTFAALSVTVCAGFYRDVLFDVYGALNIMKIGMVWENIKLLTHCIGGILILLVMVVPFMLRRSGTETKTSFVWTQIVVMAATLMTTHMCETKHMLVFVPAFIVLTVISVSLADNIAFLAVICAVIIANVVGVCVSSGNAIKNIKHIAAIPTVSILPQYSSTAVDVLKLKREIDKYVPAGELCGVIGKSDLFNTDMIKNSEESLRVGVERDYEYIRELPAFDETDGGRLEEIYGIEYLLIAFPAQTYGNGGQTIINEAVASFELYSDIATAFEEVEGFEANVGDIDVRLYKRVKDLSYSEIYQYQQRLYY